MKAGAKALTPAMARAKVAAVESFMFFFVNVSARNVIYDQVRRAVEIKMDSQSRKSIVVVALVA